MKKFLLVLALMCMYNCGSCVDDANVIDAIEAQGFTNVSVEDKSIVFVGWAGCSDDDEAAYEITAINSLGKRVKLLACAGWPFKGVTIRSK